MKRAFLLFLTIIIFQSFAFAQADKSPCPTLSVNGSLKETSSNIILSFKADVRDFDLSKLTYIWTVYNGEILNGQGTSTITVKSEKPYEKSITAVIKLQGLPENCPNTASETASIDPRPLAYEVSDCPKFTVRAFPEHVTKLNETVTFMVIFDKDYETSKLKFSWVVSKGKLVSGQGTNSIITLPLDRSGGITATVNILGLAKGCSNSASETSAICSCPIPIAFEEYFKITEDEKRAILNKFAAKLQEHRDSSAFIVKLISRDTSKIVAYQDLQKILKHLESRGIDRKQILFSVSYDEEERTRLFVVPDGADNPEYEGEILDAAKLAERLKNIKPAAKKKTAGKN
jgi:hypothetical protein